MYNLPLEYDKIPYNERWKVREQYAKAQDNLCMFCGVDLLEESPYKDKKRINWKQFPPGFLDNPIHLQHDHFTGLTEGVVHAYCNAVMWQYHGR